MSAGFTISINTVRIAAIPFDGANIVSVRLHGDDRGDELATLDASRGMYRGNGDSEHLIMIDDHEIKAGDVVSIAFDAHLSNPTIGQTIEELDPDRDASSEPSAPSMETLFDELSALPKLRDAFAIEVMAPDDQRNRFRTRSGDHSFFVAVFWFLRKKDTARVSISSQTLEGLRDGAPSFQHARFNLAEGDAVELRIHG